MNRGFLVFAQNNSTTDYLKMAYGLALSIKKTQPKYNRISVAITPRQEVPQYMRDVFDKVIEIPWGDAARDSEWKLENEWKAYHLTPYDETIKLEADMLIPCDLTQWWDILSNRPFWFAQHTLSYRGETSDPSPYRELFISNDLPNIYTAFSYFRKSDEAKELYEMAETIYHNWEHIYYELLDEKRDDFVSTDVVFALALKMLGCDLPKDTFPTLVHMRSKMQNAHVPDDDWTKYLPYSVDHHGGIKVGRFTQTSPFHYHVKHFLTDEVIRKLGGK